MSTLKKPTHWLPKQHLLQLRREYNKKHVEDEVTSSRLAQAAGVAITDVYAVEIGAVIDEETAQKVLHAFNALTNQDYPFEAMVFTPRCVSYPKPRDRMGKPLH